MHNTDVKNLFYLTDNPAPKTQSAKPAELSSSSSTEMSPEAEKLQALVTEQVCFIIN